eukprot:1245884-Amphidinium_carterae.1
MHQRLEVIKTREVIANKLFPARFVSQQRCPSGEVREAKDLTAGDHRFLRKGTSDPFCIVVLQDDSGFYS